MVQMKMIITDTGLYPGTLKPGDVLIQENGKIHPCTGCMDCWWKTPGVCTQKDTLMKIASLIEKTDELVIVSCNLYGTFSSFVQKVLERFLPCFQPEYENAEGRMVHRRRFRHEIAVSVYFYGAGPTDAEKAGAQAAAKRLVLKLGGRLKRIMFVADAVQIGGLS